jgi:hypothetical protein
MAEALEWLGGDAWVSPASIFVERRIGLLTKKHDETAIDWIPV